MQFVKELLLCCTLILISAAVSAQGNSAPANAVVPQLVNFSGSAVNDQGKPINGIVGITFSIYNAQQGGAPLWMETQNVQTDAKGNYTAQLGATTSEGLPLSLFASGEARWLGVRVNGGEEQQRVLLLSVPYALKAADAQTLGGLPASAFALAVPNASSGPSSSVPAPLSGSGPDIGGSGTENYIPLWTDNNGDLGNSILYQLGSGSTAKIGINEKSPLFTLDVNGQELVRGLFEMATTNYANKNKGFDSNPLNFESSAFNSGTGTYTLNHFQWQAEPVGNDTSAPGATLNLLYGTDPASPAETGLLLNSKGIFTFATGQSFPGTGTITGITTASGSGLSGGGTSGNLNLGLVNSCSKNQVLQWNGSAWACSSAGVGTITGITAGSDLTGGGTSGNVTLNLDTTQVPLLAANNAFVGTNSFGSVGIGTASPGSLLTVSGASNWGVSEVVGLSSAEASIGFRPANVGKGGAGDWLIGTNTSVSDPGGFVIENALNSYLSISPTGNVGIPKDDSCCQLYVYTGLPAAGVFQNDSDTQTTLIAYNYAPSPDGNAFALVAGSPNYQSPYGICDVDIYGNLFCTGSKSAVVPVDNGSRKVALYAVEAPENWFEDYGSGQLSNGPHRFRSDLRANC
jgi:hypothetical protein